MRQTKSTAAYAIEFRQKSFKLEWNDEPLIAQFYSELRSEVKDEIIKADRPSELSDYIELAVKIDN